MSFLKLNNVPHLTFVIDLSTYGNILAIPSNANYNITITFLELSFTFEIIVALQAISKYDTY